VWTGGCKSGTGMVRKPWVEVEAEGQDMSGGIGGIGGRCREVRTEERKRGRGRKGIRGREPVLHSSTLEARDGLGEFVENKRRTELEDGKTCRRNNSDWCCPRGERGRQAAVRRAMQHRTSRCVVAAMQQAAIALLRSLPLAPRPPHIAPQPHQLVPLITPMLSSGSKYSAGTAPVASRGVWAELADETSRGGEGR
jgi:hypothetical protein